MSRPYMLIKINISYIIHRVRTRTMRYAVTSCPKRLCEICEAWGHNVKMQPRIRPFLVKDPTKAQKNAVFSKKR